MKAGLAMLTSPNPNGQVSMSLEIPSEAEIRDGSILAGVLKSLNHRK